MREGISKASAWPVALLLFVPVAIWAAVNQQSLWTDDFMGKLLNALGCFICVAVALVLSLMVWLYYWWHS